jgi:large subunit ribosomal protein L31
MKKDIHPEYHPVVFQDVAADWAFLTRSTVTSDKKIRWKDGKEYPLVTLEISSASHPFFTGQQRLVDSAGRVERFRNRYKGRKKAADASSDDAKQ